ncbi:TPA: hypothetical protein U0G86_002885 [Listeria monocytogenes]|nr:hypothetical protein [Listeria monocytogenes]
MGWSKTGYYETPYTVTGSIKQTGIEELPNNICMDKIIGTSEAENMDTLIRK